MLLGILLLREKNLHNLNFNPQQMESCLKVRINLKKNWIRKLISCCLRQCKTLMLTSKRRIWILLFRKYTERFTSNNNYLRVNYKEIKIINRLCRIPAIRWSINRLNGSMKTQDWQIMDKLLIYKARVSQMKEKQSGWYKVRYLNINKWLTFETKQKPINRMN